MKQLIEFQTDGTSEPILVEVSMEEGNGFEEASGLGEEIAKKAASIEVAFNHVKPIAEAFLKKAKGISQKPDEISLNFGLKLNAQAGVIVSSSAVEANFTVTLKWKKDSKQTESSAA
jgi:hypothetical protein